MKKKLALVVVLLSSIGMANADIDACLKAWGKHPFGEKPAFKTLAANVKVVGIGSDTKDTEKTEKPELVLVKAQVSVMSGQDFKLLNPNGWYCIKNPVAVMGKVKVIADCKAHLATPGSGGVAIAGTNDGQEAGGVAVAGRIEVARNNCKKADEPK